MSLPLQHPIYSVATMQTSMAHRGSLVQDLLHSSLLFLFHPHAFRLASWLGTRPQCSQSVLRSPTPAGTPAFLRINTEYQDRPESQLDADAQYWWSSSGLALAILLEQAGYSSEAQAAQHRLLDFIRAVVPASLGAGHLPGGRQRWKSFMTDDHTPIELSWDWRASSSGGASPKIRFSIEPVGVHAGTQADPLNQYAASRLRGTMARLLPHANMKWLAHFHRHLNGEDAVVTTKGMMNMAEGHLSKEFYAFDLNPDGSVMSKAYFFPGFRARATQQSHFDVIRDAIETAPDSTPAGLEALRIFQAYVEDAPSTRPSLEMDMLAVDLVDPPAASRFKIYFRARSSTSFAAVRDAMSLGGRIGSPELETGLESLRRLYHALLLGTTTAGDDDVELPVRHHRTAGMLYNVEFKYGSKVPKVKAYLPVRHYAQSEDAVLSALEDHLNENNAESSSSSSSYMENYKDAIRAIL